MDWATVIEANGCTPATVRRLVAQLRGCEAAAIAFCRLLERWARGDAVPATPGARQAAFRHAADRVETALAGLEAPLSAYLVELEPERAEGRSWYTGPGAAELVDWRAVFAIASGLMLVLAVALRAALPSVPAAEASSIRLLVDTLRRPGIGLGMVGHVLVVLGHFLAYTYVRLALERIPEVDASTIVVLLALFGLGGLAGNIAIGLVIDRSFAFFAVFAPVVIAASVLSMILFSGSVFGVGAVVLLWGFFFSSWLIVVNTWVGHRMPDRLEAGGSLVVVGFQAAITLAAGVGGLLVDTLSVELVYVLGATVQDHEADEANDHAFSWFEDAPGMPFEMVFGDVPEPKTVKNRIHWDVDTDDVHLLVDAGATVLAEHPSWTVLGDPEGNEFCAFTPRR